MSLQELLRGFREARNVGLRQFHREAAERGYSVRSPSTWGNLETGHTDRPTFWHVQAYIETLDLTHEEREQLARAGGIMPRHPAPAPTSDASAA